MLPRVDTFMNVVNVSEGKFLLSGEPAVAEKIL